MLHLRLSPAALVAALLIHSASGQPATNAAPHADPHAAAKAIYAASCAHCHGADLHGGGAASLADGVWVHGSRSINRPHLWESPV